MIGFYFTGSVMNNKDEALLEFAGQIVSQPNEGTYLVRLHMVVDDIDGDEQRRFQLFTLTEMTTNIWSFYETREDWLDAINDHDPTLHTRLLKCAA